MRKGYIFLLDGIFAVILLVIGLIMISSNRTEVSTESPLALTLENSMSLLSAVKVTDVCNGCNCSISKMKDLCFGNKIKNSRQSLLDYVGELYSRGLKDDAYQLLKNISAGKDIFRENEIFGAELDIGDDRVYPGPGLSDADLAAIKKRSKNLLSSRKMIFGYYEDAQTGKISFWGPYEVRAELWEKQ
jgi:hypothetical protein